MAHHQPGPTPEHLPVLGRHAHLDPSDGACLMEYVSVLAGEPFSDAPACTRPVLATIARLVNDATSDTARPQLARLAPDLAATGTGDPEHAPAVDTDLVAVVLRTAADRTGHPRLARLERQVRDRQRHLARQRPAEAVLTRSWRRLNAGAWRRGPGMHALASSVRIVCRLPEADRDTALRELLTSALGTCYASHDQAHRRSDDRPASVQTGPPQGAHDDTSAGRTGLTNADAP